MNEHINIQTLPVSWFPDLESVKTFIGGARYEALSSLALGAYDTGLPGPLAEEAKQAGIFVLSDLLELGRYVASATPETFEAQLENGTWNTEWRNWLGVLSAVALAGNYVETIFEPVLQMMAEEEVLQEALRETKAKAHLKAMIAERAEVAE